MQWPLLIGPGCDNKTPVYSAIIWQLADRLSTKENSKLPSIPLPCCLWLSKQRVDLVIHCHTFYHFLTTVFALVIPISSTVEISNTRRGGTLSPKPLIVSSARIAGDHRLVQTSGFWNISAAFIVRKQDFMLWWPKQGEALIGTRCNGKRDNEVCFVFNGDKFDAFHFLPKTKLRRILLKQGIY